MQPYRTCDIIKTRGDTMKKRLYHGSQFIIPKPEYGKGVRREYRKGKKEKADINELFILDIMREGIKNGDARLF